MPSPLGHALAGLTVHVITARTGEALLSGQRAGVAVVAAVSPDLDLLLRFVDGRNHHQAESHSLGCALLAAVLAFVVARWRGWKGPRGLALVAGLAWSSHVVLDYLGRDTHPPIGIMAFWPLALTYVKFPWPVFMDIGRTPEWKTVIHDLLAVTWEAVLLFPLLFVCWRWRSRALLAPAPGAEGGDS